MAAFERHSFNLTTARDPEEESTAKYINFYGYDSDTDTYCPATALLPSLFKGFSFRLMMTMAERRGLLDSLVIKKEHPVFMGYCFTIQQQLLIKTSFRMLLIL